jgi:hypothetical protein
MRVSTKEQNETIKLVADPFAPEKTWLPACGEMSSTALVQQPEKLKPVFSGFEKLFAVVTRTSLVWGQALNLFLVMFLCAHLASTFCGITPGSFMHRMLAENGLLTQFLASIGFVVGFSELSAKGKSIIRGVCILFASLLGVLALLSHNGAFPFVAIAAGAYLLLEFFGKVLKESLPKNVPFAKVMNTLGWTNFPVALVTVIGVVQSLTHCWFAKATHVATAASTAATSAAATSATAATTTGACSAEPGGSLICATASVFLVYFVQSFVIAKATKSTNAAACTVLSIGLQMPLIVTLSLLALGTTALASSQMFFGDAVINFFNQGAWECRAADPRLIEQFWLARPTYIFLGLAVMCGSIYMGAGSGAASNLRKASKKKALELAVETQ